MESLFCDAQSAADNIFLVDFKLYSDLQEFRRGVISLTDVARVLFLTCVACVFLTCEFIHFFSLHRLCSCATVGVTPQDALADNNPWDFCGFDGTPRMEHGLLDVQLRSLELCQG